MTRSIIYSNRFLYNCVMRLLYLGSYQARFKLISSEVPFSSSVLELCFGDLYLYMKYLRQKDVKYIGIDINPTFVRYAHCLGVNVLKGDINIISFPQADIVIMQSSLYQFIDSDKILLEKMFRAANKKFIIAEPIRNLSQSKNKLLAFLGKRMVNAGRGHHDKRYTKDSLLALCHNFVALHRTSIQDFTYKELKGGREAMVVICKV